MEPELTFQEYTNGLTNLVRAFQVYVNTKKGEELTKKEEDKEYPETMTETQWAAKFDAFIASPLGEQARKVR